MIILKQIAFPFIDHGYLGVSAQSVGAGPDDVMGSLRIGQRHDDGEILVFLHQDFADRDAVETGISKGSDPFRRHQPVRGRLKGVLEKINLIMHRSVSRGGHAGDGADHFGMIRPEHIGHGGGLYIRLALQGNRQEVIVLINALRFRRGRKLQGDRIADRMVVIRNPEIPGMLALLVFNAPVSLAMEGKCFFRRTPAVFGQPCPVRRGLML